MDVREGVALELDDNGNQSCFCCWLKAETGFDHKAGGLAT